MHARVVLLRGGRLMRSISRLRSLVTRPGGGMDRFLDDLVACRERAGHVVVAVATRNGRDVGMAALILSSAYARVFMPVRTYDLMVRVRSDYRRCGVGTLLVERLLSVVAELGESTPRAWQGTQDATLFWRTFGPRVRSSTEAPSPAV